MNVTVIIVTYNGSSWIRKCLNSLGESSIAVNTIVIDNNSDDQTTSIIKNEFPLIQLIESKRNLGFGKANNIGLKKALEENADYVFLLNQDAWVKNDSIELLIKASERNKDYGILSPFHLNYDGSATEEYFNDYVIGQYTPDYINDLHSNKIKPIYSSSFVHAAGWLMPINTIKEIGGFDPLFFHTGEDNDYVQRIHARNKQIGIVPDAKLFHQGTNEGLKNPQENIPFLINQSLLLFKSQSASTKGAVVLFFRQLVRMHIINFKSALSKAYRFNLKRFLKMLQSRKLQKNDMAYLDDDL